MIDGGDESALNNVVINSKNLGNKYDGDIDKLTSGGLSNVDGISSVLIYFSGTIFQKIIFSVNN